MSDFLTRLVAALGEDIVVTSPQDVEPWLSDWRGLYKGQAQAVVRPRTTQQVSDCVKLCHEYGVPVVPRGGNTGLCGAATPDERAENIIISLDRMNAIRDIDTVGNTMTLEAGCILSNVQDAASNAGRMFPLSLAAQGTCEIGGNLATNAGGVNVVRYGMVRELVLGLEVVLPDGQILNQLHALRKDNTGYDLKQLFIGSEGTLGIITAAVVRLLPKMQVRTVAFIAVESADKALACYEQLTAQCGQRIQAYEYMTQECIELVHKHFADLRSPLQQPYPGYVLVEFADTADEAALNTLVEESVGSLFEQDLCMDAAISTSLAQIETMWRLREEIPEAQRLESAQLKHDVSIPIKDLPTFMGQAQSVLHSRYPDVQLIVFGHFGDGNLHYNVNAPSGAGNAYFTDNGVGENITHEVMQLVYRFGGSFSAEHGVGQLKKDYFQQYKSPLEIELMRQLKAVFDPKGIMNPGKIF